MIPHLTKEIKEAGKTIAESGDRAAEVRKALDAASLNDPEKAQRFAQGLLQDQHYLALEAELDAPAELRQVYALADIKAYVTSMAAPTNLSDRDISAVMNALHIPESDEAMVAAEMDWKSCAIDKATRHR